MTIKSETHSASKHLTLISLSTKHCKSKQCVVEAEVLFPSEKEQHWSSPYFEDTSPERSDFYKVTSLCTQDI